MTREEKMIESKSRFARRIGKPIWWVGIYVRRGIIPVNDRGFVLVDGALAILRKPRKRGRPRVPKSEQIVRVGVYVRRRQKKAIIEAAKELRAA